MCESEGRESLGTMGYRELALGSVVSTLRCEQVGDIQMISIFIVRELGGVKRVLWREGPAHARVQGQRSEGKAHTESYRAIQAGGARGRGGRGDVRGRQSPDPWRPGPYP